MPLHNRHEIMTKSLNLVQPPRHFVKYFTTALCISWSLKIRKDWRIFLNCTWKLTNGFKVHSYLISVCISILTSQIDFQNAAELNTTETVVEKLAKDITEVGLGIWGMCGNSYTSLSLCARFQSRESIIYYSVHCNGKRGWLVLCRTVF